jgi:hypothetical protein
LLIAGASLRMLGRWQPLLFSYGLPRRSIEPASRIHLRLAIEVGGILTARSEWWTDRGGGQRASTAALRAAGVERLSIRREIA